MEKLVTLSSVIICPHCGYKKVEQMETESCRFFYTCANCNEVLRPRRGDCCVFCSFGTVPCPPVQMNNDCC